MKKSVPERALRSLLLGLALAGVLGGAAGLGCSLGPKQDDPGDPTTSDTGAGGGADTSVAATPDGAATDAAPADTYDPTTGLDGCKQADADGGDAAHDGEVGCDAAPDADAGDAPSDTEGGTDATGG